MKHRSLQKILVGDSEKNKKIPQRSINLLNNSIKEIISKQDIIIRELQDKVLRGDYNNFLLTYKIDNKYLGEIEGFPWILQTISQGDKSLISSSIKCLVCHNFAVNNLLKEQLPFFSINNKIFIPDGDDEINSAKGLPLCGSCYDNVKSGIKYIQNIENQLRVM